MAPNSPPTRPVSASFRAEFFAAEPRTYSSKFLEKNPAGGIHHICLEVDDVRESMAHVSSYARLLSDEPKIGAHGNPVVFLHPKDCDGVLTELEQAG